MKKVIIIGGGIGGLATANLLAKKGFDVHVYEKASQLGGRAGYKKRKGFTFDTGPSWYLMPQVFRDHFALFDIDVDEALSIKQLKPGYSVFFESDAPMVVKGNLTQDAKTFEKREAGAGEALKKYVAESDTIYQLALQHFLYTDFRRPHELLKKDVLQGTGRLVRLLTTPIHKHVSAYVTHPNLQQVLEYPMVFLGTSPFEAPAMYSLMSALDFKEGVYYPEDGMYSIIKLMVEVGKSVGVTYHRSTDIRRILVEGNKAAGVMLKGGKRVTADIVISNADLHYTETQLLEADARSYPETYWKKKQAGISALLMYVGVKGSLPQLTHHNLYFVDAWKENFAAIYKDKKVPDSASMYVSRTTATDPRTAPKAHENLFVLVPLPSGISPNAKKLRQLGDHFLQQFATAIGEHDLLSRVVVKDIFGPKDFVERFNSWQGSALGMSHVLTQSALWRIPPRSKKVKNLYYVGGNTLPGIGLPMCLIGSEIVYKTITKQRHNGPLRTKEGGW